MSKEFQLDNFEVNWNENNHKDLFWFCLRRNPNYINDVDLFINEFELYIDHYYGTYCGKGLEERSVLFPILENGVPIGDWGKDGGSSLGNEYYTSEDLSNIALINYSFLEFVHKWCISPHKSNIKHDPLPNFFSNSEKPKELGGIQFLDEGVNKELIGKNGKRLNKRNLKDIKLSLQVYEMWEINLDKGIQIVVDEYDPNKVDPNHKVWPSNREEIYKKISQKKIKEYPGLESNLNKDMKEARFYILNPHLVYYSLFS